MTEKLYLFILKLLNPSLVDRNFDLVICSGSRTAIPAYLLAKLSSAKIIYIGTPKYRIMKKFDGIVSTKKDLSSVYKVITTKLPPTKFKPFEEIVEPGELDPMHVHTPGIYVDRLIQGTFEKRIELRTVREN